MNILWRKVIQFRNISKQIAAVALGLLLAAPAFAQANSPWENAVNVLQTAFTSTIARGLSLVAIVVSGLTFAFGEGGSKRVLAGVLFGVGMAIAAVNFPRVALSRIVFRDWRNTLCLRTDESTWCIGRYPGPLRSWEPRESFSSSRCASVRERSICLAAFWGGY